MKWFLGASVLLAIALVFNLGLLAYAMYALLGVMLISRFVARTWSENLRATRECNRLAAYIGESVAVVIKLENRGALPIAWVLAEDLLPRQALIHDPPSLRPVGKRLHLAMLGPRTRKTVYYQLECNRRGYYQIGPLVLETGDVFGLHRRYRVATEPYFLLVYPKVIPLAGFDLASRRPVGEVKMSYRLFEDPTRVAGVRRYERGDPLNRIHWRATARTGELHSKIYEPTTVAGITILLDFHAGSFEARHEPVRSELAITAAASLASAVFEMGQQVGLVTNARDAADRIRQEGWDFDIRTRDAALRAAAMTETSTRLQPLVVDTRRGPEQFMRILETLARAELTDGLSVMGLVSEAGSRLPRDATVVAIVTKVTEETAVALGNLVRRGYAVSALVNVYDDREYSEAAGKLIAQRIDARHLRDEAAVSHVCQAHVLQSAPDLPSSVW